MNSLKLLPFTSDTLILLSVPLPAAALESSFLRVFSCTVLAVLMPCMDSTCVPFMVSVTLGEELKAAQGQIQ